MFAAIARFDIRFRWPIVAVWFVGVIAGAHLLPGLTTVTHASNGQFLSASSPSVRASQLAAPLQVVQPNQTATIVASRASGPLAGDDAAAMSQVEQAVRKVPGVSSVRDAGTSPDGRAAQAVVTVPGSVSSNNSVADDVVHRIRAAMAHAGAPAGLDLHLAGPLAVEVDARTTESGGITRFTLLFVVVVLFVVYRAALAPLVTLIPAALAVIFSGPVIAEVMGRAGIAVPPSTQPLLIVLLLGAGTDYGLFLCFRFREELARGSETREALVTAVARVGQALTFSGLIVAAALLTMLLAPSAIFQGIGPSLAIGIAVMLVAALTLMPALLAVFGRAVFWPSRPRPSARRAVLWGRVAEYVVRRPVVMLAVGVVLFGALAAGLIGFRTTSELSSPPPDGTDSAAGAAVLAAHFPPATPTDQLLLQYGAPVTNRAQLDAAQAQLASDPVFSTVSGPVVSPDGRTVLYHAVLRAGPVGSTPAANAVPQATAALAAVARATGARASGVAGPDASLNDILASSNASLALVVPAILVLILVLLGLMLRSLVAPWYLALTVGLSYLSALGFATIVFVHLGGADGVVFILPLLMFVFSMALGEDYNVLVMSRIQEEAHHAPTLSVALTRAIGITGTTVTAAGVILAGAFVVLGFAGGSSQTEELGFSIAFSVLLDTFFVRTLLVPSIAMLLGRWNWWPAPLSRPVPSGQEAQRAHA
ncbi:MAG TPA: MMPL family transporter [Candidatus Dormibacteraeota bacterium]|nr:MMPL family transporter [Candidatus Dormibacteraeota bacterium]